MDETRSFREIMFSKTESKSKHSTRKFKIKQSFLIGSILTINGLQPFLFSLISKGLKPTFSASP